jgi:hypothetical protein
VAPQLDPDFEGIDPQNLAQLMSAMSRGVTNAQPVAESYLGQFTRFGLDTSRTNKLLADYGWATGQQSMLSRRHSLAIHQPSGEFTNGMTSVGAGTLLFVSTSAAQQAGAQEGEKLKDMLVPDGADGGDVQAEIASLAKYEDDPDYMAAFFESLGPQGLYYLSLYCSGKSEEGDTEEAEDLEKIIGTGLSIASNEFPLTEGYLEALGPVHELGDEGPYPGGFDGTALLPFLTYGTYSSQWLSKLSPYVLYQSDTSMETEGVPPANNAIFQAMANNPAYAAAFFKTNFTQLSKYMTDPVMARNIAGSPAFGAFLRAATIAPEGTADPAPFQDNAVTMIQYFGTQGQAQSSAVEQAMASIAMNYWNDMVATVTAATPDPNAKLGLRGVPEQDWAGFMQNAMQDKTSSAELLAYLASWMGSKPTDNLPVYGAGDDENSPYGPGAWNGFSEGLVKYFVVSNYVQAGAAAGTSGASVLGILEDLFADAAPAVAATVFFGPEAGTVTELIENSADAAGTTALEDVGTSALNDIMSSASSQSNPDVSALMGVGGQWQSSVTGQWGNLMERINATSIKQVVDAIPVQHYNGTVFTGNPEQYEQKYGGNFMRPDGNFLPLSEIEANPKALAAFNAWLKDPAIVALVAPNFRNMLAAEGASALANLMGG